MAATKVKSVLAGKLGSKLDQAVKAHANDDTTYGIINLPGGISNGIAQLSKCYFKEFGPDSNMKKADGTSAKGEYYFRAEGTVDSPESVATPDGVIPVKGLTTSVMIPLVEQKVGKGANEQVITLDMQIQKILNVMRQLGGQEFTKRATAGDLESLASDLESVAPFFRFSTSAGKATPEYPTPRVFENWHGNKGLENYQPVESPAFNTSTSSPEETKTETKEAPAKQAKVTQPQEPEKRVDAIVPVSEMDVDDLISLAGSEADTAQEARETLSAKAMESGWTEDEVNGAENWEAVKEMIENPKQEEVAEETPEEPEVVTPVKGQTCNYAPPSKVKPGTFQKARSCMIQSVDAKDSTATLKDLTTKPPVEYKKVPWSEIS